MPVDLTGAPAYSSKQAMIEEIEREARTSPNFFHIMRRISNTDTSTFADPTYEHGESN